MSIESELGRLIRAKGEIEEAIENKGVNVPDDKRLDWYDSYINMISGSEGVISIEWGLLTGDIHDQEDLMQLIGEVANNIETISDGDIDNIFETDEEEAL